MIAINYEFITLLSYLQKIVRNFNNSKIKTRKVYLIYKIKTFNTYNYL